MFIVTGATGKLGRMIVDQLIERVPNDRIGISVSDPDKAADFAARGIRVRRGDFADRENLDHAFEGATQLLIVSSNARSSGGDPLAQHGNAIAAARAVGAQRIVYTSHMAASSTSAFPPMHDHAATEAMLEDSGMPWTALRNGFYAESGIALMGDAKTTGVIAAPAEGKVAWTARADLAEAAAIILTAEHQHEGPTPPLTGPEALDLADFARFASAAWSRRVDRAVITDDELRTKLNARGVPAGAVGIALGLYVAARAGEFGAVDPTLERLLGRSAMTVGHLLAEWE